MIRPVESSASLGAARPAAVPPGSARGADFSRYLSNAMQTQGEEVRFSNHALQRLRDRKITLSPMQLGAIRDAVDQAAARGGRESLLLMEDLALVASVPNRTVITAMRTDESTANVFTNIDSAVVVAPVAQSSENNQTTGPDSLGEAPHAAERLTRLTL